MLVVFSPIFVAEAKIICGYNFVAPLIMGLIVNIILDYLKNTVHNLQYLLLLQIFG